MDSVPGVAWEQCARLKPLIKIIQFLLGLRPAVVALPLIPNPPIHCQFCAPGPICVHRFEALAGPMQAYFRRRDLWLAGTYQWTIDWYEDNRLAHLIALENGQFALLPSHKVKFGDTERSLPPYRKLHAEWKV